MDERQSKLIRIQNQTDQELSKIKAERLQQGDTFNQSYNDIINYLIDFYHQNK